MIAVFVSLIISHAINPHTYTQHILGDPVWSPTHIWREEHCTQWEQWCCLLYQRMLDMSGESLVVVTRRTSRRCLSVIIVLSLLLFSFSRENVCSHLYVEPNRLIILLSGVSSKETCRYPNSDKIQGGREADVDSSENYQIIFQLVLTVDSLPLPLHPPGRGWRTAWFVFQWEKNLGNAG